MKSQVLRSLTAAAVALAWATSIHADQLVTVRVGEQDTCAITGVTTSANDAGGGSIKFDLAKLPKDAKVTRALLRLWVDAGKNAAFGMNRWNDAAFDGLKVFAAGAKDPLAASYPFAYAALACHEWDVTSAVAGWIAKPESNSGLSANFPVPAATFEPAWQRPYLQITYAGENPARPKQPSEVKAFYRAGQVFLTWKQIPHTGAFFDSTYRIYVHTEPITAANLDKAALLGEANRLGQLNYRRTTYSRDGRGSYAGYQHLNSYLSVEKTKDMTEAAYRQALLDKIPLRYNFVIDDAWPGKIEEGKWLSDAKILGDGFRMLKGPELSDDAGLFVHTVGQPGKPYFAVTSVLEGNENGKDFSSSNAPPEAVEVKVEPIRPVLQVAFHRMDKGYPNQRHEIREYAYWGGPELGLTLEPSTPFYFRLNPPGEFVGYAKPPALASWIAVEGWWSHGGTPVVPDVQYVPPTRLAPFPPMRVAFSSGGWKESAQLYYGPKKGPDGTAFNCGDIGRGNYYGYIDCLNTGRDPRKGKVLPYLESRILREIELFFQEFPQASRDHVVVTGETNGLLLALHHPEVFANCSAAQEEMWSSPRRAGEWLLVGKRQWQLVNDQGHSPWDWNDPVWLAKQFPTTAWPFVSHCMSPNYARSDQTHWGECGYPQFYLEMVKDRRGGQWWWCDIGDAPNGGSSRVPRNQAYLAFTNVNFCETPQAEWKKEPRGTLNAYLVWHHPEVPFAAPKPGGTGLKPVPATADAQPLPPDMVDTPQRFEVAIRIGDRGLSLNGQSVPPTTARFGTTDITPWRFQQFKLAKGAKYLWTNRKTATGQLLQAGVVEADDRGLVTVPGFFVDRDALGNKLILQPAEGKTAPKTDESIKVGELAHAEYAKQCRNPVLAPEVKPPQTKFTLAQFTYVNGANPDGSITYKGGSFAASYDTVVSILEPGQYVLAVRAKAEHGASWPLLSLDVGGTWGRRLEAKVIDTPDWQTYYWYAKLDAGKLPIRLTGGADYYAAGMLPELAKNRLHIADLTLTKVDEAQAAKTPVEVRISPRAVQVPSGMPIQFKAQVLNALGEVMPTPVKWSVGPAKVPGQSAAVIDQSGKLQPNAPGDYEVAAVVEGGTAPQPGGTGFQPVRSAAPVKVADAFLANFNEGGPPRGWTALDLDKPGKWATPTGGHTFLNSLWQTGAPAKSLLVWEGGAYWTDCAIQAELILTPSGRIDKFELGKGKTIIHGLAIRAADRDNHYRLEIRRTDDASSVQLIKRVGGKDTAIAKSDTPPALAAFDWQTNPFCTGFAKLEPVPAQERLLPLWRMDRMKLQAKGNTLRAWLNGQELFPAGVKDSDLKTGPAGLYSENQAVFDNLIVTPAQ